MAENVSRVGDVRPHPVTGFRQVLTQRGKHTRWIDTPEQAGPTQVLHNGFAKDPASLSPQELDEVRAQAQARSAERDKPVSAMGRPQTAQPKVKEPSITEAAMAAGRPLKKQKDIASEVDAHTDHLSAHITSLKSLLSSKDLPEDHPAVKAVDEASDHLAATQLLMHGDDKNSYDFNKRPNSEAVAAGRERPRENKTEAEQALTSATAGIAHAVKLLNSKSILSVEGATAPPVPMKAAADNHEHAKTFHIFGFRGSRAGHMTVAGTTIYGNDEGVRGAVRRIREGKAAGAYQGVNLTALIRGLRGTKRFTAGQLAEQGITRQDAAKSVEWKGPRNEGIGVSLGAAAVQTGGAKPWSGREGTIMPEENPAPRSGMARPKGAVRAETVGQAESEGNTVREALSVERPAGARSASLDAFHAAAGTERVRASINAAGEAAAQAETERQAAIEKESGKILRKQARGTGAPRSNPGLNKAMNKVRKGKNG